MTRPRCVRADQNWTQMSSKMGREWTACPFGSPSWVVFFTFLCPRGHGRTGSVHLSSPAGDGPTQTDMPCPNTSVWIKICVKVISAAQPKQTTWGRPTHSRPKCGREKQSGGHDHGGWLSAHVRA
jgi:hypothetical protein